MEGKPRRSRRYVVSFFMHVLFEILHILSLLSSSFLFQKYIVHQAEKEKPLSFLSFVPGYNVVIVIVSFIFGKLHNSLGLGYTG